MIDVRTSPLRALAARCSIAAAVLTTLAAPARAGRFLFDATKSEMAGNADWVVDSDAKLSGESNPQRVPTGPASAINASTAETYWTGALSSWAITMVRHGNGVESLPRVGGSITYGNAANAQDLAHYKTFVICEPNNLFTASEKAALINFVAGGGGLFLVSDHTGSDRDNDGADSVAILNDLFTNNAVAANPFGIAVNLSSTSQTSTNINAGGAFATGVAGTASNLEYNAGATLTTSTTANASVRAAAWTNGSQTGTNAMMAYASYGLGRVVVLGDSSPADDGSGDLSDSLYTGWTTGTNGVLISNASDWVNASPQSTYDATTGGSFANAAAWTGGVPDAAGAVLDFKGAIAAAATVTLDRDRVAATLRFDGPRAYAIAGTNTLTLGATPPLVGLLPGVVVTSGSHAVTAPLVATGRTDLNVVQAGSTLTLDKLTGPAGLGLSKSGAGQLLLVQLLGTSAFNVTAGSVRFTGTPTTAASAAAALTVNAGASLDLNAGALAINYASASPLATIKQYLADGRLKTTAGGLTIGYAEAGALGVTTFAGVGVDATSLLLRATQAGDTNLDLAVNFDDLLTLAQHYGITNGNWGDGDFTYDGVVDFDDLLALAQHYGGAGVVDVDGTSVDFAADWALARSLVPEPAAVMALTLTSFIRRRRR